MDDYTDYTDLPSAHREVLDACVAEAWRNIQDGDAHEPADVAADIAQRLVDLYHVTTYER